MQLSSTLYYCTKAINGLIIDSTALPIDLYCTVVLNKYERCFTIDYEFDVKNN